MSTNFESTIDVNQKEMWYIFNKLVVINQYDPPYQMAIISSLNSKFQRIYSNLRSLS
ncbi:MAG: hypothetical protein RIR48_421 [Bacteroidota bacterium]|jgi:hypothetical protein